MCVCVHVAHPSWAAGKAGAAERAVRASRAAASWPPLVYTGLWGLQLWAHILLPLPEFSSANQCCRLPSPQHSSNCKRVSHMIETLPPRRPQGLFILVSGPWGLNTHGKAGALATEGLGLNEINGNSLLSVLG